MSATSAIPPADTAVAQTRENRIKEIRDAIQTMVDALDSWQLSDATFFPASLELAFSAGLNVVLNGDIPAELMAIFAKCVKLGEIWAKVLEGEDGLVSTDGIPTRPFFDAFAEVRQLLEKSEVAERKGIEPVADLIRQMKDNPHCHEQIARMYGKFNADTDRWSGPFFFASGAVNVRLIEAEAASPGSVVPPGFNPLADRQKAAREEGISALEKVRRKLAEASGAPVDKDPATVEQLLREGQFPDVIASVKGVTEKVVRDLAAKLSIRIIERDDQLNAAYAKMYAEDQERKNPTITDFQDSGPAFVRELDVVDRAGAGDADDDDLEIDLDAAGADLDDESADDADGDSAADEDQDDSESETPSVLSGDNLKSFVADAHNDNPDVTVAQIRAKIEGIGMTASPIAVGRALSAAKNAAD